MNRRKIERPYARRKNGGWVYNRESLIEALKKAEVADIGGVQVGTQNLVKVMRQLPYSECLVRVNGNLEVETVMRVSRRLTDGQRHVTFRKPKHDYHWFRLLKGAWVPHNKPYNVVIIKPRKF